MLKLNIESSPAGKLSDGKGFKVKGNRNDLPLVHELFFLSRQTKRSLRLGNERYFWFTDRETLSSGQKNFIFNILIVFHLLFLSEFVNKPEYNGKVRLINIGGQLVNFTHPLGPLFDVSQVPKVSIGLQMQRIENRELVKVHPFF